MTTLTFFKLFFSGAIFAVILDYLWIGVLMKNTYLTGLDDLLRKTGGTFSPDLPTAALVYVFILLGIIFFVLPRLVGNSSFLKTFGWGFFFGTVTYAIYELTNYSLLDGWPASLIVIDTLWGGVLCGLVSTLLKFISK